MVHALWADRVGDLDKFEAWLVKEPVSVDPEELELRNALGLRTGG